MVLDDATLGEIEQLTDGGLQGGYRGAALALVAVVESAAAAACRLAERRSVPGSIESLPAFEATVARTSSRRVNQPAVVVDENLYQALGACAVDNLLSEQLTIVRAARGQAQPTAFVRHMRDTWRKSDHCHLHFTSSRVEQQVRCRDRRYVSSSSASAE